MVYITFGQIHVHRVNNKTFDRDCVARVKGDRSTAFELFGDKWHQCFESLDEIDMSYYPRGVIDAN